MQKYVTEESMPSWKNLSAMFDTIYDSCAAGKLQQIIPINFVLCATL